MGSVGDRILVSGWFSDVSMEEEIIEPEVCLTEAKARGSRVATHSCRVMARWVLSRQLELGWESCASLAHAMQVACSSPSPQEGPGA